MTNGGDDISPDVLWHYTSWEAAEKIISSKTIWASHIAYLNDEQELRNAIDIAICMARQTDAPPSAKEHVEESLRSNSKVNICVASFSAAYDQLSQWRAYGNTLPGIALGFDVRALRELSSRSGPKWRIVPCEYDRRKQGEMIDPIIDDWRRSIQLVRSDQTEQQVYKSGAWHFLQKTIGIAPRLKDSAYLDEREWRIVMEEVEENCQEWTFHRAHSLVVPHIPIKLEDQTTAFPVRSLLIGPNPHMDSAVSATKILVSKLGINVGVLTSQVPYRSW